MKIHFIAIGGSIMHNLAIALHKRGYEVSGSDDEIFEPAKGRLAKYGLLPAKPGWFPNNIDNSTNSIILGMHAKKDNPELKKARKLDIPVYSFPQFIAREIEDKLRVVIAGSHGKTTITSMIMYALKNQELSFDYMVGAGVEGFEDSVQIKGDSQIAVLEGDEYLSSPLDPSPKFLHYKPQIALISGISWDHMNVFPTYKEYVQAFRDLLESMQQGGKIFYFEPDEELRKLVKEFEDKLKLIPYKEPEWKLDREQFSIEYNGKWYDVEVPGKHNLWNLQGAMQVCKELGVNEEAFLKAVKGFKGAGKRLEVLKEKGSTVVYRDFAHAPSKVKATLEGLKAQYPDKKLVSCLELHTYSSLNKEFLRLYSGTTGHADHCLVYINPHALKMKNMPDISPAELKEAFHNPGLAVFKDEKEIMRQLQQIDPANSIIVFMSSGNFNGADLETMINEWI